MNALKIVLPYEFVSKKILLTWYDIWFGIKNGFLEEESAVQHSYKELEKSIHSSESVMNLAIKSSGESIYPFINELAKVDKNGDEKITKEKFLYLILSWLYEHQEQFSDPLDVVDIVYADFGYPEKISNFIKYMPSNQSNLSSLELNRERLLQNWREFLEDEEGKYR